MLRVIVCNMGLWKIVVEAKINKKLDKSIVARYGRVIELCEKEIETGFHGDIPPREVLKLFDKYFNYWAVYSKSLHMSLFGLVKWFKEMESI